MLLDKLISKGHWHLPKQSVGSAVDCVNAEIENFLSPYLSVHWGICTSVNEPIQNDVIQKCHLSKCNCTKYFFIKTVWQNVFWKSVIWPNVAVVKTSSATCGRQIEYTSRLVRKYERRKKEKKIIRYNFENSLLLPLLLLLLRRQFLIGLRTKFRSEDSIESHHQFSSLNFGFGNRFGTGFDLATLNLRKDFTDVKEIIHGNMNLSYILVSVTTFDKNSPILKVWYGAGLVFGKLLYLLDNFMLPKAFSYEAGQQKHVQCDQIGRFLKVFGNKISSKSSPNDWQLFGLFWKTSLLCKTALATSYFLGNFWKKSGYFLLQQKHVFLWLKLSIKVANFRNKFFCCLGLF